MTYVKAGDKIFPIKVKNMAKFPQLFTSSRKKYKTNRRLKIVGGVLHKFYVRMSSFKQ